MTKQEFPKNQGPYIDTKYYTNGRVVGLFLYGRPQERFGDAS